MEIWKPVKGYEGLYEVSSEGRVRSIERTVPYIYKGTNCTRVVKGTVLKQKHNPEYCTVDLCKEGIVRQKFVHRLVASAFIPNPNNLPQVNHKDEVKTNNAVENLEWCTGLENVRYGTGNARSAKTRSRAIAQYTLDGKLVCVYESISEVRRKHGWAESNISRSARGVGDCKHPYGYNWRYVSEINARESIQNISRTCSEKN